MRTAMKKYLLRSLVCLILCLLPCVSGAVLVAQTELVSGKIAQINDDHSVTLDDGSVYRPSRQGLKVDLRPGEAVTLRYLVEPSGDKMFFEYAPGMKSLEPLKPYSPKPEERQNK